MSYTKGPWFAHGEVWTNVVMKRADGSEYPSSAIVADTTISTKLSDEEIESNTHLIATAPELLEFLVKIRNDPMITLRVQQVWEADELIAKATGVAITPPTNPTTVST